MGTATFDTLQAARTMEAAGLERPAAEAIAEAINQRGGDYVTRADLSAAIARLENRLLLALLSAVVVILAGVSVLLTLLD